MRVRPRLTGKATVWVTGMSTAGHTSNGHGVSLRSALRCTEGCRQSETKRNQYQDRNLFMKKEIFVDLSQ